MLFCMAMTIKHVPPLEFGAVIAKTPMTSASAC